MNANNAELRGVVSDVLLIAGAAGIVYAAHLVYPPAAYALGGLFVCVAGWLIGSTR